MRSSSGTFPFRDNNGTVWLGFADWGTIARDNLLLCVHGHTRQGRDFAKLAEFFAAKFHTIGFDLAGHGKSGWLADKTEYSFETSMRHIDGLIDYLKNPTSYDGLDSIAEVHPSIKSADLYPRMRSVTDEDLYAIAGHILLQPKIVTEKWGGGKIYY